NALGSHEPGHLVTTDVEVGSAGGLPELAPAIDRVVVFPELGQRGAQLGVAQCPVRRRPGLGGVIGGGGELQLRADRLDPPSTPTSPVVPVGVDEGDYFLCRRASSAPTKLAAACKMSLDRCRSRFFLRSSTSSARSVVVRPPRSPASTSACLTHERNDSR